MTTITEAPRITFMPAQRMAVVHTLGDPAAVGPRAARALYATVLATVEDPSHEGPVVGALRARWPNAHLTPKDRWLGIWGLPIGDDVTELPQPDPGLEVAIELWEYGDVAEAVHVGPFDTEPGTTLRLHAAIAAAGYAIAGAHEEEYLTPPGAPDQRTIIRYPIRPMKR